MNCLGGQHPRSWSSQASFPQILPHFQKHGNDQERLAGPHAPVRGTASAHESTQAMSHFHFSGPKNDGFHALAAKVLPTRPEGHSSQPNSSGLVLSSVLLYVHRDRKDGEPGMATSTFTQLLSSDRVESYKVRIPFVPQSKLPSRTNDKVLLRIYLDSSIDIFAGVPGLAYREVVGYWLIPTSQEVRERETIYLTVHRLYPRVIWHQGGQRARDFNVFSSPVLTRSQNSVRKPCTDD